MDGKLLGINTAIFSQSGGSIGIGFATPSGIVARVVDSAPRMFLAAYRATPA